MIRRDELRRLAARAGVRVELQERDYVLGCFLLGLHRTRDLCQTLVLKGGTSWTTVTRELRGLLQDWLGDHVSATGPDAESPV